MRAATKKDTVTAPAANGANDGSNSNDVPKTMNNKRKDGKMTVAEFKEWRKNAQAKAERTANSMLDILPRPDGGDTRRLLSTVTASNPFLMRVHELRREFPLECSDDRKAIRLAKKVLLPEAQAKGWSIGSTLDPKPEQAGRKPQPVDLLECCWALRHNWPLNPDLSDQVTMVIKGILTTLAGINTITPIGGIRYCEHSQKGQDCKRNECLQANGAIIAVPMLYAWQPCGGNWMNLSRAEGTRAHLYRVAKEVKDNYDKLNSIQEVRVLRDKEGKTVLMSVERDASKVFRLDDDKDDDEDKKMKQDGPVVVEVVDEKDPASESKTSSNNNKKKRQKKKANKEITKTDDGAVAAKEKACPTKDCPCHPVGNKEMMFKWLLEAVNGRDMNARMDHITDQTKVNPDWWDELKQEGGVFEKFCERLGSEKLKTDLAATMLNDLVVMERKKKEKPKGQRNNPYAGLHHVQDHKGRRSDEPLLQQEEESGENEHPEFKVNTWRTPETVVGGTSSLAHELAKAVRENRQGTITTTNDTGQTIEAGTVMGFIAPPGRGLEWFEGRAARSVKPGDSFVVLDAPPPHQLDKDSSSNPMGTVRTPKVDG
jgi:hypothetical protein